MQFEKIEPSAWTDIIRLHNIQNYYAQTSFLYRISNAYRSCVSYYAILDKSEIIAALPIIHKGKDASFRTHFFYQFIYIKTEISERKKIEALNMLVSSLTSIYDKIDFKFDINFNDIRAFTWNGFTNSTYYTYLIPLNDPLNYSENIKRQIKKYQDEYSVELLVNDDEITTTINNQVADMLKNGIPSKESPAISNWLMNSYRNQDAEFFVLKNKSNEIMGSAIYLKDLKKAYLISTMSKDASQVLLYDYVFNYYKSKGLKAIDLLGANIPNIAIYKSQFDAQLQSYIIVSYRKNKLWEQIKSTLKLKIKSMLNK